MEFIIFLEEFIRVTGLLRTERMSNVTAEVMSQSDKVPNPRMIQCLGIYQKQWWQEVMDTKHLPALHLLHFQLFSGSSSWPLMSGLLQEKSLYYLPNVNTILKLMSSSLPPPRCLVHISNYLFNLSTLIYLRTVSKTVKYTEPLLWATPHSKHFSYTNIFNHNNPTRQITTITPVFRGGN